MSIEILKPLYLLLIPILLFFVIHFGKNIGEAKERRKLIVIIRCVIVVFLAISLVNIRINKSTKDTATVFLLDMSYSNEEFKENGEEFIKDALKEMGSRDYAGVVVFGEDSKVEKFISNSKGINSIETKPKAVATNIQNAINTSLSLFPSDKGKRIVLITDGEENLGELEKTIPSIIEQNIDIKVFKVENAFKKEVYVDSLKLPEKITMGDEFSIGVNIYSNIQTKSKVFLYAGRVLKGETEVSLETGNNSFVFKDVQNTGGFKNYKVVIQPQEDTEVKNNEYIGFTNVISKEKVFIAEGTKGEGDNLANMLSSLGYSYDIGIASEAPSDLKEMLEYKGIISVNSHIDDLPKGFKNSLENYVKEYGGSFITTGGENSYALGGYMDTPLENVLPVYMDMRGKKEIPKMSITLVIDHSGSMSGGNGQVSKLTLAKEAAQKAVDTIREGDEISVIAFDDSYEWIVKGENGTNKDAIKEKIGGIQIRGGTSIYPALNEAYEYEKTSDAKIKHIILLTDGQDGFKQYTDILNGLEENKITLSTVSVGEDADKNLLQRLAEEGKGRSYHTDVYTDIPRIFAKEIFMAARVYLNNREFTPKLVSSHEVLNGVFNDDGAPSLLGYVGTSPKERATVVLNSDEDDPILALWQYGLGRTVSWTSDVSGKWNGNYIGWEGYKKLWNNILNWSLEDYSSEGGNLNIAVRGNEAKIEYKTNELPDSSKVKGIYTKENGEQGNFEMDITSPGVYEKTIDLDETGFYSISVREELEDKINATKNGVIALQYPIEYKIVEDSTVLERFVEETTGKFIKLPKDVFTGEVKKVMGGVNLSLPLAIMALLLLLFEIAYRRLDLNINLSFFKKIKINLPVKENKKTASIMQDKKINVESTKEMHKEDKSKEKPKKVITKKKEDKQELDTSLLLKRKQDRNNNKF